MTARLLLPGFGVLMGLGAIAAPQPVLAGALFPDVHDPAGSGGIGVSTGWTMERRPFECKLPFVCEAAP